VSPAISLVVLGLVPLSWRWQLRFIYYCGRLACQRWRAIGSSRPPWPLSDFEAPFQYDRVIAFAAIYFLPLAVFYVVIIPVVWLFAGAALLPFWAAEKLRARLTPENPNYLDLVAYMVSVLAMIRKLLSLSGIE